MIDLHSHILPGLDDGAQNIDEALDMARIAVDSGIRAMVATPHCMEDRAMEVWSAVQLLRKALEEEQIPLRLFMGMEIMGTEDTARLLREGKLFTLNNSRYPLVEFSFYSGGDAETDILRDLIRAGYRPLVAHPERYVYVREDPELINEWKRMGCLFQVNRGSLMGRFGNGPLQMAGDLVNRGFATVVASDAHSPKLRTPCLRDVQELLRKRISPAAAEYLLLRNPITIVKNEDLPPVEPEWF